MTAFFATMTSCSAPQAPPPFSGERAYGYLEEQVALGPRVPGSSASAACRSWLYRHLTRPGFVIDSQLFSFFDRHASKEIPMVNVVAHYTCGRVGAERIVLVAHYDSRPRSEYAADPALRELPLAGANDGASGVAVLIELADNFVEKPPPVSVDLVFVDGEDWGRPGESEDYLLGSRYFARGDIRGKYRFGLVLDMVGDKDQQIYREGYSEEYHSELNDLVWQTARSLGITTFVDSTKHVVMDDHLSLSAVGVPTIDIIDFDYAFWHSEKDTPDKCSPEALANVGRVVSHIVYNPSLWPEK